jgi:hypothetical protein
MQLDSILLNSTQLNAADSVSPSFRYEHLYERLETTVAVHTVQSEQVEIVEVELS